jgi:hypothetical protein
MSTETGEKPSGSLYARLISRQRSPWITAGIGLLLILIPVGAAYLDGVLGELFSLWHWRPLFLEPVVTIYILIVAPILARKETDAIKALRPQVLLDDARFDRLVAEASQISPIGEGIAFGAGAVFGLWVGRVWISDIDLFWLTLYLPLSASLMFGLLGWTIYYAVAGTRLIAAIQRQPLRIDIFDTKPFEPVGRQSLAAALVFVGGIALGMLFGLGADGIFAWQNWVMFACLAVVPVLIFFLSMRDTHRVLTAEKKRELEAVQQRILASCRILMAHTDADESTSTLAAEINALVAYEARIQAAQTWPYNTTMLRTLFFSAILPGGAAIIRAFFEYVME